MMVPQSQRGHFERIPVDADIGFRTVVVVRWSDSEELMLEDAFGIHEMLR